MSSDLRTLPKLMPAIKKRWLKALRSGKYEQCTGRLRSDLGYCCLGVLADVVKDDKKLNLVWSEKLHGSVIDGSTVTIGPNILRYILATPDMYEESSIEDGDFFGPRIARNDGLEYKGFDPNSKKFRPQSFTQIAKLIETHC